MKTVISNSLEETNKIAAEWLEHVSAHSLSLGKVNGGVIVGLSGDLGSGKTTFTQSVALSLGITEFVTSPTFVIMKIYPTKHALFKKLIHIDAYRFEKPEELAVLNFEQIVADPDNLILIEWAEKIAEALPVDTRKITFEVIGENQRKIIFE